MGAGRGFGVYSVRYHGRPVARSYSPLNRVDEFPSWLMAIAFARWAVVHGFAASKPIVHQGVGVWFVSWTALA